GADDILGKDFRYFVSRDDYKDLSKKMIKLINNYSLNLSQLKKIRNNLNRFLIEEQSLKYLNYCNEIFKNK
ncbi:hypothetical protein OAP89_03275, partial [Candidatus Pelagibacter sp.]|nr:hypothetical protein [Candidatus Pelagibacter sp.]